jgi:gluconate 2-dehydrogenase gamma chain
VPADAHGPGALELGIDRYIERTLRKRPDIATAMRNGLHALASQARLRFGRGFGELDHEQQDELLSSFERGTAERTDGGAFFELLRELSIQGMFGDPCHGGNADSAGWRLIGYSGVRLTAASEAIADSPRRRAREPQNK